MEVTAPLDTKEKSLSSICSTSSISDEMDCTVCGEELKRVVLKVADWYGFGTLLSLMRS